MAANVSLPTWLTVRGLRITCLLESSSASTFASAFTSFDYISARHLTYLRFDSLKLYTVISDWVNSKFRFSSVKSARCYEVELK